jgi:hypothetical protein
MSEQVFVSKKIQNTKQKESTRYTQLINLQNKANTKKFDCFQSVNLFFKSSEILLARSSGAECREYLIRNSIKIPN